MIEFNPPSHAVDLMFQATNVMMPIITGYLVLFVGAIGTLWDMSNNRPVRIDWRLVGTTLFIGILALGFFASTMHFGISYALPNHSKDPDSLLKMAGLCIALGYTMFIIALVAGAYTCFKAIRVR